MPGTRTSTSNKRTARRNSEPSDEPSRGRGGSRTSGSRLVSEPATPARTTSARKSTPRKNISPERFSVLGRISPERRMDILGVVLVIVGLLTVLSLFSINRSSGSAQWVEMLRAVFGWGVFIVPMALILLGAWLVARNVERLPALTIERLIGILMLFTGLLAAFQGFAEGETGGGYLGAFFERLLVGALGLPGTVIVVVAWLLIGMAMTLDLSMEEMFRWVAPLWRRLRLRLQKNPLPPAQPETLPAVPQTLPGDFTPLQVRPADAKPAAAAVVSPRPAPGSAPIAWTLPRLADILEKPQAPVVNEEFIAKRARLIEETLSSFGAPGHVVEISRGPAVTMFGVEPQFVESRGAPMRVRVGKISALADDLALVLAAPRIRIQAPVPGKGYVGIEVPNEEMSLVALREIVESDAFSRNRSALRFALGKDVAGHPRTANLETMPHLLIAGTTGSGKSVCVNAILSCLLLHNTPDDLRLILVDPKRVELTGYNGVPHLLAPVVVEIERVIGALQWMTREMDNRYHKFAELGARNIADYNTRMASQAGKKLPYLVIVIDELADLMMISPEETERTITRLAQLARATGIHMILATQRPSVDVVTGLIKANFPARIAFAVASNTDSRVILDQPGAERLLGRGDMLFQAPDAPAPVRYQGVFVSDLEINRLVDFWRTQAGAASPYAAAGTPGLPGTTLPGTPPLKPPAFTNGQVPMFEDITAPQGDPLLDDAIDTCRREGRGSVSMLQRKLRIGYTRAARIVDSLEAKGILGPPEPGTGVREVLDYGPAAPPKEG